MREKHLIILLVVTNIVWSQNYQIKYDTFLAASGSASSIDFNEYGGLVYFESGTSSDSSYTLYTGLIYYTENTVVYVWPEKQIPVAFSLGRNFPNPTNSTVSIPITLPYNSALNVSIFDINGRLIKTLHNGDLGAGEHIIFWDGMDNTGNVVSSGVYFIKMLSEETTMTRKITLLK
jgi:hypothetical protein